MNQADLELRGLSIGEECTMVRNGVHANTKDLAVLAKRQLSLQVYVSTEPGGDQVAGLVLDPLHRTFEQDGREDRNHIPRIHRHFVAETAAQVRRDDADHVFGNLGHHGHRSTHDVWSLARHVDGEFRSCPIVIGYRAAGLDRTRVRARIVQLEL